jgi:peptide chain release factor 1
MSVDLLKAVEPIEERFKELTELLADPAVLADLKRYRELSKEHAEKSEIINCAKQYKKNLNQLNGNRELIRTSDDEELLELAQSELEDLEKEHSRLTRELELLLIPKDPDDRKNAIVEIRAGTGGEEAALFASDLFRMYSRFIEDKGWKLDIMNTNATGLGGIKEIIFSVDGNDVYSHLKFESGVHRVQRVPQTETSGRLHTSAASVAVLPEAEEVDIKLEPNELKIDVFRSSGPGGQSVNTTDSAVRITHIPTGTVVTCQDEKSQLKNKNKAFKVLRARLHDRAMSEQHDNIARQRKTQVGTGDRSEKIRTYNFPQNRVTDHRFNLTLYNLENIINGEIDELISAAKKAAHQLSLVNSAEN